MVVFAPLTLDNNNSFSVGQFADYFHIPRITHLCKYIGGFSFISDKRRGRVAPCMCRRVASSLLLLPPVVEDLKMRSTVSLEVEESIFFVFVLGLG